MVAICRLNCWNNVVAVGICPKPCTISEQKRNRRTNILVFDFIVSITSEFCAKCHSCASRENGLDERFFAFDENVSFPFLSKKTGCLSKTLCYRNLLFYYSQKKCQFWSEYEQAQTFLVRSWLLCILFYPASVLYRPAIHSRIWQWESGKRLHPTAHNHAFFSRLLTTSTISGNCLCYSRNTTCASCYLSLLSPFSFTRRNFMMAWAKRSWVIGFKR